MLIQTAKLRATASHVYHQSSRSIAGIGDSTSWAKEWRHLESDLLTLANAPDANEQGRVASRMHRTYLVFRV